MNHKTKRGLKLLGSLTLASAMLLSATGCGSVGNKGEIAVIVKSQGSAYWDSLKLGVDDAAGETGYSIYYDAPPSEADITVQEDIIKSAIEKKVKAIVIAPIDAEALNDELAMATEAGIPVVCVDSDCTFKDKQVFISSNNLNAGSIEGRHAGELLVAKGGGTIAIVGHTYGAGNAIGRIGGFIDTLVGTYGASVEDMSESDYISGNGTSYSEAIKIGQRVRDEKDLPEIRIVDLKYCDAKLEVAKENTKTFVNKYPGLDMIFATNQQTTLGSLQMLDELGMRGKITLLGFDSGDEQIAALQSGTLEGLIAQSPYNMGYLGIRYANKCINNEKIPSLVDTGVTYVDKSNLNDEEIQLLLNPNVFENYNNPDGGETAETEETKAAE